MKNKLALILNEDNIRSNKWSGIVNYSIIFLIVISALQIILEVDPRFEKYSSLFEWIDIISISVFTIEYLARFWVSDIVDARFNGNFGKVKYFFSFYALLDLIAILPYYISLIFVGPSLTALRILRVIRILRLARFMKSFDFIVKATRSKRSELLISMQVVVLLTFVLSVLLYHVENEAQPDNFSTIWAAMLWSFSKFIGDIGGYGDFTPVTSAGMLLATGVGILSIAIFAVPAGIIASGFVEEIEAEKQERETDEKVDIIESSFGRTNNTVLGIKTPVRKRTLPVLQSRLNYTDNEIFEAVRNSERLRIKWEKSDPSLKVADMIALEHFIPNAKYGVHRIVDESKIYIVNPIGKGERGISHFANTLAEYGEFNLVSNEIFSGGEIFKENKYRLDINPTYSDEKQVGPEGALDFMHDVTTGISVEDWVIVLRTSASHRKNDLHILYGGDVGDINFSDVKNPTINDHGKLEMFVELVNEKVSTLGYNVCTHEEFKNKSPNLLHSFIRSKTGANVVTLFISVEVVSAQDRIYYAFLKTLKECLDILKKEP